MSFVSELRRRNVLRLAAAYALVAWILIEAGSVLLPTFGAPEWLFRAWVIAIFAGFVVSLVLAWLFEWTPEGVRRDSEVDRTRTPPRDRSRSNSIIIGLLAVALAVSITFNVTGVRDAAPPVVAGVQLRSVAVLPFTSRSSDPDNQHFADGVHDDLLTRLAELESVRVIARTSVNAYRDTSKDLRQIGDELGVETVVTGAVQRSGRQVRVTVQLIDAARDEQLWADTFDRALTAENVFQIQSEVSSHIAGALRAALTPEDRVRLAVMPTNSIAALSLYTSARNNLYLRRFETLLEAREQFESAIAIDPGYAQAYAGLAETVLVTMINHNAIAGEEAYEIAGTAIDRALQLDDKLAEAWAAKGLLEFTRWRITRVGDGNLEAAAAFERSLTLKPNLAIAYVWFASLREAEADYGEAIDLLTTAMQIDPLARIPYVNLPNYYSYKGEFDEVTRLLLRTMDIFPDWATPVSNMAGHLARLGRLDESVAWMTVARTMTDDPLIQKETIGVYIEFGDTERILEFTAQLPAGHPLHPISAGFAHFLQGEYEETIATFEDLPADSEVRTQVAYPVMASAAVMLHRYDEAREYLIRANPLLASDTDANVDRYNLWAAIMLAYVHRQQRDERQAAALLSSAWDVVQDLPRMGMAGHGIADVHILAIQGRKEAALDALRAAIDEGFVSLMVFDYWTIDHDIFIDNLRNEPRFIEMREEIEVKLESMRENVRRAEESGDWTLLLDRARRDEDLTASLAAPAAADGAVLRP